MHEDREEHSHAARTDEFNFILLTLWSTLNLGTTYHGVVEQNRREEKRREETKDVFVAPKMRPNFGCITGHLGVGVF